MNKLQRLAYFLSCPTLGRDMRCPAQWYYKILQNLILFYSYLRTTQNLFHQINNKTMVNRYKSIAQNYTSKSGMTKQIKQQKKMILLGSKFQLIYVFLQPQHYVGNQIKRKIKIKISLALQDGKPLECKQEFQVHSHGRRTTLHELSYGIINVAASSLKLKEKTLSTSSWLIYDGFMLLSSHLNHKQKT